MPIIAATDDAQSGVSTTAASTPISAEEMPSPNSAVAIGSPEATTLPNVNSSTRAAIAKPTVSEEISPRWALPIASPPSSTRTPSPLRSEAMSISRSPVSSGTAPGVTVSGSRATAIVPSRENSAELARHRVADALERRGVAQEGVHPLAHRRRLRAARLPDHVDRVGRALGEAVVQQLDRGARLRARRRVVGRPVAAQRAAERDDRDQRGDPARKDEPAAAECEVCETAEHW